MILKAQALLHGGVREYWLLLQKKALDKLLLRIARPHAEARHDDRFGGTALHSDGVTHERRDSHSWVVREEAPSHSVDGALSTRMRLQAISRSVFSMSSVFVHSALVVESTRRRADPAISTFRA